MDYLIEKLEDMLAHAESDVESYRRDAESAQWDMGRVRGWRMRLRKCGRYEIVPHSRLICLWPSSRLAQRPSRCSGKGRGTRL
jgi:hypothetical protein